VAKAEPCPECLYAANRPKEAIPCYQRALPLVEDPTEVIVQTPTRRGAP